MSSALPVIAADTLNDVDHGEKTVTVGAFPGLKRDTGQPAQAGDVLSVQPDGSYQTRPLGAAGPFERCKVQGSGVIFRPKGTEGPPFFVPLALDWPNK
jgi:hypothetical protein